MVLAETFKLIVLQFKCPYVLKSLNLNKIGVEKNMNESYLSHSLTWSSILIGMALTIDTLRL